MSGRTSIEIFDSKRSEQYILSIRLSTDGFYFVVYNPQHFCFLLSVSRKLDASLSYLANLKLAFRELDFLSCNYKQVYVLSVDRRYTLIPLELFEEDRIQELFGYNFTVKDNEIVCKNMLPTISCAILHGMDKNLRLFLNETQPGAYHFSQTVPLIEFFSVKSRSTRKKLLFACLRNNYVDVYCFDRGYLSLVNSFGECNTAADFSYYILFVWKQLGLDQLNDQLYILGNSTEKAGLLDMLKNFVKNTAEFEIEAELGNFFSERIEDVPYDIQVLMSQNKGK